MTVHPECAHLAKWLSPQRNVGVGSSFQSLHFALCLHLSVLFLSRSGVCDTLASAIRSFSSRCSYSLHLIFAPFCPLFPCREAGLP